MFTCVGSSLGVFDPDRVPELHLPTFPSAPVAVEPEAMCGRKTASKEALGPCKFMLGVNSPVVPARIVKRILSCDFGDMAELSNENLELEKRRSGEGDDAKSASRGKLRPLPDLLAWARAFTLYTGVVLSVYPNKGMELATYQAMILHGPDSCDWWRTYDPQFREQITNLEKADFTRIDQTLYSRSLWTASAMGSQRAVTPVTSDHTPPPRVKRKRSQVCYAWNDGKLCPVLPCRYAHLCAKCGGDHRRSVCVSATDPAGGPVADWAMPVCTFLLLCCWLSLWLPSCAIDFVICVLPSMRVASGRAVYYIMCCVVMFGVCLLSYPTWVFIALKRLPFC